MPIPIESAAPRVRDALRTRSGQCWKVVRQRQGRRVVGLRISVSNRYGDPDKMTISERRRLAEMLGYDVESIGRGGVEFTIDQLDILVNKAERGLAQAT